MTLNPCIDSEAYLVQVLRIWGWDLQPAADSMLALPCTSRVEGDYLVVQVTEWSLTHTRLNPQEAF